MDTEEIVPTRQRHSDTKKIDILHAHFQHNMQPWDISNEFFVPYNTVLKVILAHKRQMGLNYEQKKNVADVNSPILQIARRYCCVVGSDPNGQRSAKTGNKPS